MRLLHCQCGEGAPANAPTLSLPPIPSRADLRPLDELAKELLLVDDTPSLAEIQASPNVPHMGEPQPAPQRPLERLRVVVSGSDAALGAVLICLLHAAGAEDLLRILPEGYDTIIDQDGGAISAGERQLITIARAFLAQPALLILDEATSSVDTRTEVLVQEAMNALRADRTSFVIAHRLSTIRDADLILVMENGTIVEQGSHDDLLETQGAYWCLHQSQFNKA